MNIAIIPCSKEKIWDINPEIGAVQASKAYRSAFHRYAAAYARKNCNHTLIFSAKYGLMEPDFLIEGTYDVTFSRAEDPCISLARVQKQAERYNHATSITVLCPQSYAIRLEQVFSSLPPQIHFPLRGIGGFGHMHRYLFLKSQ
ncbi:MAG: hypothetical protein CL916_12705 [Deltaproteobacteria bacterium]|nr:hypothetical protein [Deltaproteobacteria bacterium]